MIYHAHQHDYDKYGYGNLDDLEVTVRDTTAALKQHRSEFDSIIVTGLSGTLVGAPVALRLRRPLVVLRKDGEKSHSGGGRLLNQLRLGSRALFLADFISDGDTFRKVRDAVEKANAHIVARYLYRDDQYEDLTRGAVRDSGPLPRLTAPRMLTMPEPLPAWLASIEPVLNTSVPF